MGKVLKKITALLLCVMMIVPAMSFSASAAKITKHKIDEADYKYMYYTFATQPFERVMKHYFYPDGNAVKFVTVNNSVIIKTLDRNFKQIDELEIIFELPIFCGFYAGKTFNYIIFGQNNYEEDLDKEVYRIIKYDKDFNRISDLSILGKQCYAVEPFDSCSIVENESGNELVIHGGRTMFASSDGLNHQSNFTIVLNTQTMTPINQMINTDLEEGVAPERYHACYVSHSMNQLIKYDNDKFVLLDHGDSYPRSIILHKRNNEQYSSYGGYDELELLKIPGYEGNNFTGIFVNGFEISNNNYIVSINMLIPELWEGDTNHSSLSNDTRNAVLLISNKSDNHIENVKRINLTNFSNTNMSASAPYLIKLSNEYYAIMWKEFELVEKNDSYNTTTWLEYEGRDIKYAIIDENGTFITDIKSISDIDFSYENRPTLIDNKIVWVYQHWRYGAYICELDLTDELEKIEHTHNIVKVNASNSTCCIEGNNEYFKCDFCGKCFKDSNGITETSVENESLELLPHVGGTASCFELSKCTVCGNGYGEYKEHEIGDWIIEIEPKCYTEGKKFKKCTKCDYTTEKTAIPATGHVFGEWTKTEPTCTAPGRNRRDCINCNYYESTLIQPLSHTFSGELIVTTPPTCQTEGEETGNCSMCGKTIFTIPISAINHTPGEWETVTEPNCGNPGQKVKKCTMCNETVEETEIPALDTHTPGEWETITASTCTTVGKKVQKCTGCGEIIEEDIIPTSEHTAGEWQYAMYPTCSKEGMEVLKCTVCGGQIEYRSVPALPHTPGEWVVVEEAKCGVDGKKAINCTVCHIEIESEIIDAPEHVESDWIIVREPTCSKEGIKQKRCTVCLEYISDRYEKIEKLPHSPASYWTNVSNATCTEDGLKIKKCTVCGGTAEELIIEATGHVSGEWKTIISPTCNGAGVKIKTCNVCGQESQRIEVNPTGHTPASEWTVRKLATCTEDGEMYKKCIVCNMDAETQIIDALGHNLDSEWIIEQNATCTEDGMKTQNCTRCDHSVSETIPATGHAETGWLITATADCLNPGTKIKKCTVCGIQTDSVSIPATGHTVGEWEILETSTCSREGTKVKRCSDCGTVTKSESIPRSGHEKGNWVITETPTGGSYGVKARFCIGCGMKMEEKIIYSVSNIVVKDDATGVEVVYPDGTFTGTMTLSARNLAGSEIGSKVYSKLGECNFKGYEVKFFENGIQVNPSNTYSVRIPVPYSFNRNSAEVYGISMTTGELYKVAASYENGYFLIENADTIQYVITEKIITVSLSQTHLDMKKGDTVQLYAYTNGQNVTFTSSNPSVATVDIYGNVTAVGNGSAVITATVDGTTVKEECTVEVTQSFFDMIISAISEAFSGFLNFFTDIFKSINGSLS